MGLLSEISQKYSVIIQHGHEVNYRRSQHAKNDNLHLEDPYSRIKFCGCSDTTVMEFFNTIYKKYMNNRIKEITGFYIMDIKKEDDLIDLYLLISKCDGRYYCSFKTARKVSFRELCSMLRSKISSDIVSLEYFSLFLKQAEDVNTLQDIANELSSMAGCIKNFPELKKIVLEYKREVQET